MEKKMDKQVVIKAMNPLDVAFANIATLRKTDTGEIKRTADKVKQAVAEEVVRDVAKSLLEGVISEERVEVDITPPKAKKASSTAAKKAASKKPVLVKKATPSKKAEPKVEPVKTSSKSVKKGADKTLRGSSTALKPTKMVWVIADRMFKADKKVKRADILTACKDAGITFYTARTQYQLWRASKS